MILVIYIYISVCYIDNGEWEKKVAINEDLPSCKLTVRCGKSTLTVDHFPAVYGEKLLETA